MSHHEGIITSSLRTIRALEAVPTVETALFVSTRVPRGAHLLEIGCGNGELAALLARVGYRVRAVDGDADGVRAAQAKGVDAIEGSWPDVQPSDPVDAVLFARCLHHCGDMTSALERAWDAIVPGGVLLVEDFAHEAIDAANAGWLASRAKQCADRGLFVESDNLMTNLASLGRLTDDDTGAAVDVWHAEHGDHLQTSLAMTAALRTVCGDLETARCPYFYRYLVDALVRDRRGFLALRDALADELAAILEGAIEPVGRRWVAYRR